MELPALPDNRAISAIWAGSRRAGPTPRPRLSPVRRAANLTPSWEGGAWPFFLCCAARGACANLLPVKSCGVFFFFLLLALALLLPAFRDPAGLVVGDISHPGLQGELFHQWDFLHNAREGRLWSYYFSDQVSLPDGQDIREYIGFSLHLFFYLPFIGLRGLVAPYNILILFTLALNGFCAFLLCRRLTRAYWPALACGILFLVSPYAGLKIEQGFLQKAILWWIPLFLLGFIRWLETGRKRDAFGAGLAWAGMLLTYAPYAWYALPAAAIFLTLRPRGPAPENGAIRPRLRGAWPMLLPALPAWCLLMFLLPQAGLEPVEGSIPAAIAEAPVGSLDLLHPFRFFPYAGFRPAVAGLPLGLSAVTLATALAGAFRRSPWRWAFLALAFAALLIAPGPWPSSGGVILSGTPLPHYFLSLYAPWGKRLGYAIRILPFFELAAIALASYALAGIRSNAMARALCVGVIALAAAERAILAPELFPPIVTAARPDEDTAWLRARTRVNLHLPFNVRGDEPHAYCALAARSNTRMMNRYLRPQAEGFPIPPLPGAAPETLVNYLADLRQIGVTHVVIHPRLLAIPPPPWRDPNGRERMVEPYSLDDLSVLREWLGPPVYESPGRMIVYATRPESELRALLDARPRQPAIRNAEALLIREARAQALDQAPGIARQTRAFENRLIVRELIDRSGGRIEPTDGEMRAEFAAHPERYSLAPQARLHHFLVPLPPDADTAARAAAWLEVERLLETVAAGPREAFEAGHEMTRSDPGGLHWGDLGFIGPGRLPPDIEQEVFALQAPGDCAITEDAEGYHLFRLMDFRPGRAFRFDEARDAIRDQCMHERRSIEAQRLALAASRADPIKDDMVFIEGGEFRMGSTRPEIDWAADMARRFVGRIKPVRREWFEDEECRIVRVRPFFLDRREVTIREARAFFHVSGRRPPEDWAGLPPEADDLPAGGLTWAEADAFAAWAGKRLPTVEEWEYAARGPGRRVFPWGNELPDGNRANYADSRLDVPWNDPEHDDGFADAAPVGSFPAGATPDGILDMAGNVREWTATILMGVVDPATHTIWPASRRGIIPGGERLPAMRMRAVKGGSFDGAADDLRAADMRMLPEDTRHPSVGFRCARDAAQSANDGP